MNLDKTDFMFLHVPLTFFIYVSIVFPAAMLIGNIYIIPFVVIIHASVIAVLIIYSAHKTKSKGGKTV